MNLSYITIHYPCLVDFNRNMLQLPGRNHAHVADAEAHERCGCGSDDSSRGRREKYVSALWATRRRIGNTLPVDANSWDMLGCSEYDSVHIPHFKLSSSEHSSRFVSIYRIDPYQISRPGVHLQVEVVCTGVPSRQPADARVSGEKTLTNSWLIRWTAESQWNGTGFWISFYQITWTLCWVESYKKLGYRRGSILLSQKQNAVLARVWTPNNDKHQVKCLQGLHE